MGKRHIVKERKVTPGDGPAGTPEPPGPLRLREPDMKEGNPVVQIAGVVGGVSIPIVALLCIFAPEQLWVAGVVVGVLAVMGIVLGAMARKKQGS